MYGLNGDPISNPKVPLDVNIICSLLGAFLRADPENRAYEMPTFRVAQLVERIESHKGEHGIFHGSIDANVVELIGCLYVLCIHLGTAPNVDSESIFNCARCLHTVMGSALVVMHRDFKQQLMFSHPYTLFARDDR